MTLKKLLPRAAVAALAALLGGAATAQAASKAPGGHVFVIVLENQDYDVSFGAQSGAPYLSRELPQQGALLTHYYGIAHHSLGNYIAMISGQSPNKDTQADCRDFAEFKAAQPQLDSDGQAHGTGCVYPKWVPTLSGQLDAAGLTWRAYMEDMGNDPAREAQSCAHPAIGAEDNTHRATVHDQYATRHNPFMYFHAIIDDASGCAQRVVNLKQLSSDLANASSTPNFAFITPNLCNDGHDSFCANHEPGGLPRADRFLQQWVPQIIHSPAFGQDGILIITFDESATFGGKDQACCGEAGHPGPNTKQPGISSAGGGRVGAIVLSSRYVKPNTRSDTPYNHYSLLRTVEDLFGLPHLGYAALADVKPFGADVFGAANPYSLRRN